ncbi:hypothetical protein GGF46_003264 [Coemansia sp. RSA 552]|nr:hypothetical protein GGF46_003264 [Coemansia sp. RSA 552]
MAGAQPMERLQGKILAGGRFWALCFYSDTLDPFANLAAEDWLLRHTDADTPVLFLWRNRAAVVIGRNQNAWAECDLATLRARDVWLARRTSGGGAVYHDPGNTNYTVLLPRAAFGRDRCAQLVACALRRLDVPAHVTPRHDVAVGGRKVSGSAFRLTRARALAHGTMLIDADLARLSGCLRSRHAGAIAARGVASVPSPVANLRDFSLAADHAAFCAAVRAEFAAAFGPVRDAPLPAPDPAVCTRLASWDWRFAQTPAFEHRMQAHFAWGSFDVVLAVDRGRFVSASVAPPAAALAPPPHLSAALADIARLLPSTPYTRAAAALRLAPVRAQSPHAAELCDWLLAALDDT